VRREAGASSDVSGLSAVSPDAEGKPRKECARPAGRTSQDTRKSTRGFNAGRRINSVAQGEVRDAPPIEIGGICGRDGSPNKLRGLAAEGLAPGERAARVTRERVRAVTGDPTGVSATCATAQETCDSTSQTGCCLIVPRVAMAGLRAPGCDQAEGGWKDSRGGPKARGPDLGGVKGCHPPSHHPHPPQRRGCQILVV
jgi:hypothetical protein